MTSGNHDTLPEIEKRLKEEDGIWLGEEQKEIVFKIAREVAGYVTQSQELNLRLDLMQGQLYHKYIMLHIYEVLNVLSASRASRTQSQCCEGSSASTRATTACTSRTERS